MKKKRKTNQNQTKKMKTVQTGAPKSSNNDRRVVPAFLDVSPFFDS